MDNNANYNHLFKSTLLILAKIALVVLVGDAGVGKTHLLNRYSLYINLYLLGNRYVKGKLPQNKPSTIGVEFATKNIELRNGGGIVKA